MAGEDSKTAIIRETREEISLDLDPQKLQYICRYADKTVLIDIWLTRIEADIDTLKMKENEVSELRWFTLDELQELISAGQFMPSLIPALEKCFITLGLNLK